MNIMKSTLLCLAYLKWKMLIYNSVIVDICKLYVLKLHKIMYYLVMNPIPPTID